VIPLNRFVGGDLGALPDLRRVGHARMLQAANELEMPLTVSPQAVLAILEGLLSGSCAPEVAQEWASFVQRGYLADTGNEPIRAIRIDYEPAWENQISAAVSRLEELGDLVDGTLEPTEIGQLIRTLQGQPSD
jgi:hypothetical protein